MRLLRSEFLRARSRRLVPMLIVAGLLGILVGMGIAAITANPPTDPEVAEAQAAFDKQYQRCVSRGTLSDGGVSADSDIIEEACRDRSAPYMDGVLLRDLGVILQGTATFVILLGALLGASLGGADWTSNTMTTLLTWEPRRARVFLARALVVAVFVAAITVFLQAAFSLAFALVAATRGWTMFIPSHFLGDVSATIARVSAMATAIGLVAYVVGMIGRSTVSSLGALFGYLILVEGVIAGFRQSIQGNLLVRGASVIVSQQPIYDTSGDLGYYGSTTPPILMDVQRAWIVVAVYLVVLGGFSLFQFQRRDVS
jgi:ABC-2 type transport system permease protein